MEKVVRALLLTDVVDSTKLVGALGEERAAELWAAHDSSARELLPEHRGREIDKTDGFLLLFESSVDAAGYVFAYHRALAALSTELGVTLQARAGLHVGEVILTRNAPAEVARGAKPLEVDGLAKPTAARIMGLALGGQTLLSDAAREALGDLTDGSEVRSHGHYRLKGVAEPMELFEIGLPESSPFAPPPDAAKAYRVLRSGDLWKPAREIKHALPAERDAYVGRTAELHALAERLDRGERLVTVLGMGGTGKTRFVRRYGWTWLGDWPGGVYFCDLSEARGLEGIASAVAGALDVQLGKGDPLVQLGHAIAGRGKCLVILDNFEQVSEHAGETVGRWLDRATEASFVVTSRELLAIPGEHVQPLGPLPADGAGVELFVVRAQARKAGFALTPSNESTVKEIVTLLDGLPLAIELAAARSAVLSPEQLLVRLKDRFRLLVGARGTQARQATLRAAIDWSWTLLSPWEQVMLAQTSVFVGGFTLEAAERVVDLSAWPEAPPAMDVVQSLVDKSILRTWTPAEEGRLTIDEPYFGMYVSIHEYAAEKLRTPGAVADATGESWGGAASEQAAQERHGEFFADFGSDEALQALSRHGGVERGQALRLELDNLVAACRRAVRREDGATAVGAQRAAWAVLEMTGPLSSGCTLASEVLELESLSSLERMRALLAAGRAAWLSARADEGRALVEQSSSLARRLGHRPCEVQALGTLGNMHYEQGRRDEARECHEQALAIVREVGDGRSEAYLLNSLGSLQRAQGRPDDALAHYQRAISISRERGDPGNEAGGIHGLQLLAWSRGRLDEARGLLEQVLAALRKIGNRRDEVRALVNLGSLGREQGRVEEARQHYEQGLVLARELGDRRVEGILLGQQGALSLDQGRLDEVRALLEEALAIHREVGNPSSEGLDLGTLAGLGYEQGRLDEARALTEQVLAIARELDDRRMEAMSLAQLGRVHQQQGRLEEACRSREQAIEITRQLGERPWEGVILGDQGRALEDEGRPEEARALQQRALAVAREVGNPRTEAAALRRIAVLDLDGGRLEQARDGLAHARRIAREAGDDLEEARVRVLEGDLESRRGRFEEAELSFDAAEQVMRTAGAVQGLALSLARRALHACRAGDRIDARSRFAEAESLAEEMKIGATSELGRLLARLREELADPD
jgi:predicted ATPase/class 3 adenylate cyclase